MADIITTLHPENDANTNLYPNIKNENIPNGSIDRNKLDSNINSLLNNIGELHPSGVDTSANILAFTENKGVYIGSDTGNWYYWNGTAYVSGGTYQATAIADDSINPAKTTFITPIIPTLTSGGYYNRQGNISSNADYYRTDKINITKYQGNKLLIRTRIKDYASIVLFDKLNTLISYVGDATSSGDMYDYIIDIPSNAYYIGISLMYVQGLDNNVKYWLNSINTYIDDVISPLNEYELKTPNEGYWISGVIRTDTTYKATDLINISKYVNTHIYVKTSMSSNPSICLLDKDLKFISQVQGTNSALQWYDIEIPANAYYIGISCRVGQTPTIKIGNLNSVIADIDSYLQLNPTIIDNSYYRNYDGNISSNNSFNRTELIDVSMFNGCTLYMAVCLSGNAGIVYYDKDMKLLGNIATLSNRRKAYTLDITSDIKYVGISNEKQYSALDTIYVSNKNKIFENMKTEIENNSNNIILNNNGGACRIFHKWGCIGDSLTSGGFEATNVASVPDNLEYPYSYPQVMARTMNVSVTNYSAGGDSAKSIYENDRLGVFESSCQVYTIALGTNDTTLVNNHTYDGWGSASDIDLSDYTNNANTFVGWIAKIIQRLQASNPDSQFFLITTIADNRPNVTSALEVVASVLSRVHVIYLEGYLNKWANYKMGFHLDPYGYLIVADYIMTLINNYIINNEDKFKQVCFYNTTYENDNYDK